jgi:hypothetical protein
VPTDERAGGLCELLSFDAIWSSGFAEERWNEITRPGVLYRNIVDALRTEHFDCLIKAPVLVDTWKQFALKSSASDWSTALGLTRVAASYAEAQGNEEIAFTKLVNGWQDLGDGLNVDWAYLALIAVLAASGCRARGLRTLCVPVAYCAGTDHNGRIGCLVLEFIETSGCGRCAHSSQDAFITRFALASFGRSMRRAWEWASRQQVGWSVQWRLLESSSPGSMSIEGIPLRSVEGASASGAAARAFRWFWNLSDKPHPTKRPIWQSQILVMCSVSDKDEFGDVDAVPDKTEAALKTMIDTIVVVESNLNDVMQKLGGRSRDITDIRGLTPGPDSGPLRVVRLR